MSPTQRLTALIDRLHDVAFHRLVPRQTFRYLVCGGVNFVVTIACYAAAYHVVFGKQNFALPWGLAVVSPHVAAIGLSLPVNILVGFWLQQGVSFRPSPLKGRVQLFRYAVTTAAALAINYALTKLFVEAWGIYPTVAQMIIYCVSAVFSFVVQKHYAFRGAKKE